MDDRLVRAQFAICVFDLDAEFGEDVASGLDRLGGVLGLLAEARDVHAGIFERLASRFGALCRLADRLVQLGHAGDEFLLGNVRHLGRELQSPIFIDLKSGLLRCLAGRVRSVRAGFGQT
ncbi:hypothetical protein [Mesorhizobium sp. M0006]|uniref:hypothetical protein n=1 Tax=Mesorhizobium sp. M0006 TaxID=2956838 RepID=UPI0033357A5B